LPNASIASELSEPMRARKIYVTEK
jgi:hypothetical protein